MSLTYDQHKAAIDAAYPTPPIEWARQDDHITFRQEDVAAAEMRFNGEDYHYLGNALAIKHWRGMAGAPRSWTAAQFSLPLTWKSLGMMPRPPLRLTGKTTVKRQRVLLAISAYGKDVVDDQPGDVPVVRLSFLHIGGTGTARPSPSTLAYRTSDSSTLPPRPWRRLR